MTELGYRKIFKKYVLPVLKVNEKEDKLPLPPTQSGNVDYINIAKEKPVFASSIADGNYKIEAVLDGDYNTAWRSSDKGSRDWLYIDLGESKWNRCYN